MSQPLFDVPRWTADAPAAAELQLGWDETGLWAVVAVTGSEWSEAEKLDELWRGDSVELHLAPYAGALDQCQWVIAPGMDPRFPEPRVFLHDHRRRAALRQLPALATVTRTHNTTGYQLTVCLPWTALDVSPRLGREVAFQIMVNQQQSRRVWFPLVGAAGDSRKLQRLRLSEGAALAVNLTPPAEPGNFVLPLGDTLARAATIESRVRPPMILALPAGEHYRLSRRQPGRAWELLAEDVPGGEFADRTAVPRRLYEYGVARGGEFPATDYFWAGHELPLTDRRGRAMVVVEESVAEPVAGEIRRLMQDLVGDGWEVLRREVAAAQSPAEVRELIRAEAGLDSVLLLGHVPVPSSGNFAPDGHDDHRGAWPADVYYGAESEIPGRVKLAVGRVDFHDLPAFPEDEVTLLRRYLDRNHAYRHGRLAVESQAWIHDGFAAHPELFAASGWQNFSTLVGVENIRISEWPHFPTAMQLLFYGCGMGGYDRMFGFGDTAALTRQPLNAVFTMLFGSYFGDWNTPNNLMRAALATEGGALTCGWAGRPHWYLHPLGLGATVGDCGRLTQNNSGTEYQPTGQFARGNHIALLGDPTLRLHRVVPPTGLRVEAGRLSWQPAGNVLGYHVYRAATEAGPFERLTDVPVATCEFQDRHGTAELHYMVRAVARQSTPTGSYDNASQGIFTQPTMR